MISPKSTKALEFEALDVISHSKLNRFQLFFGKSKLHRQARQVSNMMILLIVAAAAAKDFSLDN